MLIGDPIVHVRGPICEVHDPAGKRIGGTRRAGPKRVHRRIGEGGEVDVAEPPDGDVDQRDELDARRKSPVGAAAEIEARAEALGVVPGEGVGGDRGLPHEVGDPVDHDVGVTRVIALGIGQVPLRIVGSSRQRRGLGHGPVRPCRAAALQRLDWPASVGGACDPSLCVPSRQTPETHGPLTQSDWVPQARLSGKLQAGTSTPASAQTASTTRPETERLTGGAPGKGRPLRGRRPR